MALGVGDQRVTLTFTSGARGRRYRNHRQHWLSCLAVAAIIRHTTTVSQQKIDALGAVHRAATTKTDDRIDVQRGDKSSTVLDHARVGIDLEIVKTNHL